MRSRVSWRVIRKAGKILFVTGMILAVCTQVNTVSAKQETPLFETNSPLQLGYCQSESYYEFDKQFYYLVKGLEEYGLISEVTKSFDENVLSRDLWQFLSTQNQEGWKVHFVPEAYVSLDAFGETADNANQAEGLHMVMAQQGVELMLTMGTKAGIAAKQFAPKMPFMNFMAADPLSSGIVMDTGVSKSAGTWAMMDPENFTRSMSVMYDVFRPKTIGVVYSNNEEAYIYSGARELDSFCKETEVEVKREYVEDIFEEGDYNIYRDNLRDAHEKLAQQVDVFILTTTLLKEEDYDVVLEPFYETQVPVYSINSVEDVKYGALMAVEASDYQNIGRFGADTIKKIMAGEKLEEINQIYQTAPFLVLNYTTAKRIGYQPDFTMLYSASKIYR